MEQLLEDIQSQWEGLTPQAQEIISLVAIILAILLLRQLVVNVLIARARRYVHSNNIPWDEAVLDAVERPLRWLAVAAMLGAVLYLLELQAAVEQWLNQSANTLVIVAVFLFIYSLVTYITRNTWMLSRIVGFLVDDKLLPFIRTGMRIVLIAFAIVIILHEWGYDVNGLIAGLGIGGLAVALAAQETLANLFGFTTIVGDRPFVEGEYIITPDVEGIVESVGLRSTRIRQLDQAYVTVPNSKLSGAAILNWSRLTRRRYNKVIGVTYSANSEDMQNLLNNIREMLKERDAVDPETVVVYFTDFGDSALQVLVRCYVNLADWGEFTAEQEAINLSVMDIVESLGLSFAFPSQSLYLEKMPERLERSLPPLPHEARVPDQPIPQADAPDTD